VPEYIDEVIQALIEKGVPFVRSLLPNSFVLSRLMLSSFQIFCHASPFSKLPEEITNNIKSSGLGFLTTWAPQQYVLNHPVRNQGPTVMKILITLSRPQDGFSPMGETEE